jgi:WD40 repeat protein
MKTQNIYSKNYFGYLLFTLMFSLLNSASYSQFVGASASETNTGVSVYVSNTGNDILTDGDFTFKVSVWSDLNAPGIGWYVYDQAGVNTYTGNNGFLSGTIDYADVCLVKEGSDIFAVVAWADAQNSCWYSECFQWTGSAFTWISYGFLFSGTFGTTVNIDSDDNGHFVIVFDDDNQNIYAVTGFFLGGGMLS